MKVKKDIFSINPEVKSIFSSYIYVEIEESLSFLLFFWIMYYNKGDEKDDTIKKI